MRKITLTILIVFIITAIFLVFHFFILKSGNSTDYSAYYSNGGYAVLPSFPPSIWLTFSTINTMSGIDKEKIGDMNSFLDKSYSACNSSCSDYFLFEFISSKKKLGFDESEIRKNYEIHKTLLDRYEKNINITDPFFLLAVNEFNNPLILNNSEKKILLVSIINETQGPLPIQFKIPIIMAIRSCNFSNSELDEIRATYSQKYTSFCNIPKLDELKNETNGNFSICTVLDYLVVKQFCGQKLTEDEKSFVADLLSKEYIPLNNKICKQEIYNGFANDLLIK